MMKAKVYCRMSNVPWYHSFIWWLRDFYPYAVSMIDDSGKEIFLKSFKCRWSAERFAKEKQ